MARCAPPFRALRAAGCSGVLAALALVAPLAMAPQAAQAQLDPFASGVLLVQGNRLTIYADDQTTDADQILNLGERGRVRTCFGGPDVPCGSVQPGDPRVSGLVVRAELRGPELPQAVPLETVPGGSFFLPSLQQEGDYRLENIRLVSSDTDQVLGFAEPSLAILHVREIVVASASVRTLSLEELRERGIELTEENFQAFDFAVGFAIGEEFVEIEFPVVYSGNGTLAPLMKPRVNLDGLPPDTVKSIARWQPPQIVPFKFEGKEREALEIGSEGKEELFFPVFGAIVIPGTVTYLNQFFEATLVVANGAPGGSEVELQNMHGTLRLPGGNVLRMAQTEPPVALGQAVPVVGVGGDRSFAPGEQGTAAWTIEGLRPGTHAVAMDIEGDLVRPGRDPLPVLSRTQAAVEVVDARFNLSFSHPDVVREGEEYTLFVTVSNLSRVAQNLVTVEIRDEHMTGAHPADPEDDMIRVIETLEPGQSETVEYELVSELTGKVIATTFQSDSTNFTGTIRLRAGVGELGIPLSPATLIMPKYTEYVQPPYTDDDLLVKTHVRLFGLAYSLAVAPAGMIPPGLPRVIKSDVERRAIDLAEAGQRIFLQDQLLESLHVLLLDQLGNRHQLEEYDELRRRLNKGLRANDQIAVYLRREQENRSLNGDALFDHFTETMSYTRPFATALLVPDSPALRLELHRLTDMGPGRLAYFPENEDQAVRTLPWGEMYRLDAGIGAGSGVASMAVVGHVELDEVYRLEVVNDSGSPLGGRLRVVVPDGDSRQYRELDFGTVTVPAGSKVAVDIGAGIPDPGAGFQLYTPGTGARVGGSVARQPVPLPPFRLIGARQEFRLDESGPDFFGNWIRPNRYGAGLTYLFNRPPSKESAETPSNYRLRGTFDGLDVLDAPAYGESEKVGTGAWLQPNSERVVNVRYDQTISALMEPDGVTPVVDYEHLIDTAGLLDTFGNSLSPDIPMPRMEQAPLHTGGLITGRVRRGTGEYVEGCKIEIIRFREVETLLGTKIMLDRGGTTYTDADGRYFIDYIEFPHWDPKVQYSFGIRATVPEGDDPELEPAEATELTTRLRRQNRLATVDIALLGRGHITGRLVYLDDQTPAIKGRVAAASTLFNEIKTVDIEPDGSFRVPGMPVGPITLTGSDEDGRKVYATVGIERPGTTVDVHLEIQRQSVPKGEGTVIGRVLARDPETGETRPLEDARVACYSDGALIGQRRTDEQGRFLFEKVTEGRVSLQAADWRVSRSAAFTEFPLAAGEVQEVDLLLSDSETRTVRGRVLFEDPIMQTVIPIEGAVAFIKGPGNYAYTDANGWYEILDVPVQGISDSNYTVSVIDTERKLQGSVGLQPILDVSDSVILAQDVILREMEGSVRGVVLDPLGRPAAGVGVVLLPWAETFTAGDGTFKFDNVPIGKWNLVAHWESGLEPQRVGWIGQAKADVIYAGHQPFITVRMRGSGRLLVHTTTATATGILTPIYYRPTYYSDAAKNILLRGAYIETTTNQLGDLELELPVGEFELVAYNPFHGIKEVRGEIEYPGQVKNLNILFEDAGVVYGQVVDVDGKTPVPDIQVQLHTKAFKPQTQYTDAQGYFRYELAPKGNVAVTAAGLVGTVERVGRTMGSITLGGQELEMIVQMKKQGTIEGQVLEKFNGDLRPLPYAQFTVQENTYPFRKIPNDGTFFVTDAQGKYRMSHLYAGRVNVVARDSSQISREGSASGEITADWQVIQMPNIVMTTSIGRLETVVRDPETGGPVASAQIRLSNGEAATSDDQGIVIFEALPLGTYSIYAFDAPTGRSGRVSGLKLASPGQRLTSTVYLDSRGEIRGTLYDDTAKTVPVPGGIVSLSGQTIGGRVTALATTSGQPTNLGRFVFGGIPEGEFNLRAGLNTSVRRASAVAALTETAPIIDIAMVLEQVDDLYFRLHEKVQAGNLPIDLSSGIFSIRLTQGSSVPYVKSYDFTRQVPEPGTDVFFFPDVLLERSLSVDSKEIDGEQRSKYVGISDILFNNPLPGLGTIGDPFEITLSPKGTVRVTVYDATGALVQGAAVNLSSSRGRFPSVTNENGQAVFYAVPAGNLTASATAPLTGFGGRTGGSLVYDDDFIDLVVHLAPVVRGHGIVYQPVPNDAWDGDPASLVPAPDIIIEMKDSTGDVQVALTDENGTYRFDVLAVGNYTLAAQDNNGTQVARATGYLSGPDGFDNELTSMILDASPPRILSIVPPVGTEGVSRRAQVEIVFSEPLASDSLPSGTTERDFVLRSAAGAKPAGSWSHEIDGEGHQIVRFTPSVPYDNLTLYSLVIDGGSNGVKDRIGRLMTAFGNVGSNFRTSDSVGPAVIGTVPTLDLPVNPESVIRVDFNEAVVSDNEALDGDLIDDAAVIYALKGNGDWVPMPVVLFLTRNGYSLQVEPIQGLSIQDDTLRRRLVVDNLVDIYDNPMPRYEATYRIWDENPPSLDAVPYPDGAPTGQLFQGATYTIVPQISALDDVTAENPGGDLARVEYYFQDPEDPSRPATPGYEATSWPFSYTFIGAYSGNGTDPKQFPLWVRAVDTSTNQSEIIEVEMVVLPNSPPTVGAIEGAALSPIPGTFYAGSRLQATVQGLDDIDGNQLTVAMELWRDGQNFPIKSLSGFTVSKPAGGWGDLTPPSRTFDLPLDIEEGAPLFFKARVYDSQGALAEVESERYPVADDDIEPVVDSLQIRGEDNVPQVEFYIGQRLKVRFRARDIETAVRDVEVTFDRDDILTSPLVPTHRGSNFYETSLLFVPPDVFTESTLITATVRVTDYGDTVAERTITFEVAPEPDPTAPDPTWLTPWSGGPWPAHHTTVLPQNPGTPFLLRAEVTDTRIDELGEEVAGNIVEVRMAGPVVDDEGRIVLADTWQVAEVMPGTSQPGRAIYQLLWHIPNDLEPGTELPFVVRAVDSGGKFTIRYAQMVVEPARRVFEGSQSFVSNTDAMLLPDGEPTGAVFVLDGAIVSIPAQEDGSIRTLPGLFLYTGGEIDGSGNLLVKGSRVTSPEINSPDSQILYWPFELHLEHHLGIGHGSSLYMIGRGLFGGDLDTVVALPGETAAGRYAGGSHGGYGWKGSPFGQQGGWNRNDLTSPGSVYGSVRAPSTPGSGGRSSNTRDGARGGGVVRLDAASATVHLAGNILVRGETPGVEQSDTSGGGGAGGSVRLAAGRLEGPGTIDASGGRGVNTQRAGGGGGGRIAVSYGEFAADFDPATQILARGGTNHPTDSSVVAMGGAGTIFLQPIDPATGTPLSEGVLSLGNHDLDVLLSRTPLPSLGSGALLAVDPATSTVVLDVPRLDGTPLGDDLVLEDLSGAEPVELAALEIVDADRFFEASVGAFRVRLTVADPDALLSTIPVGTAYRGRGRLLEVYGSGKLRAFFDDEVVLGPEPGSSDDRAYVFTEGDARIALRADRPLASFDATPAGGDVLLGSSISLGWEVAAPLGVASTTETWSLAPDAPVTRTFSNAPLLVHQAGTTADPQPLVLEIPFATEPGEVSYTVDAEDVAARTATSVITWNVLPNEDPTAAIGGPADVRAGYPVTFDLLLTDREGLAQVVLDVSGPVAEPTASATVTGTEQTLQLVFDTDPFATGDTPVTAIATVTDASGAATQSAAFVVAVVPNDLPTGQVAFDAGALTELEPAESTTLTVHAEDPDGLASVELVTEGPLGPASQTIAVTDPSVDLTFDLTADVDAVPGTAQARAILTDRFGAVSTTDPLAIEILPDTVPPTLEVADLAPLYHAGETLLVVVSTEDSVGVERLDVTFDGQSTTLEHIDRNPVFTYEVEVDRSITVARTTQLQVVAYDFAGNASAPFSQSVELVPDQPAVLGVTILPDLVVLPGTTLEITADATDDVGITAVDFALSGAYDDTSPRVVAAQAVNEVWRPTLPTTLIGGTTMTLTVDVTDTYGHVTTYQQVITVAGDGLPPEIQIFFDPAAAGDVYLAGEVVTITVDAQDNVEVTQVSLTIDGQTITGGSPLSVQWTVPALTEAIDFPVDVTARDPEDNVGTAQRVIHAEPLVNDQPPTVEFVCLTTGAMLPSAEQLALSLQATDDQGVAWVELYRNDEVDPLFTWTPEVGTLQTYDVGETVELPTVVGAEQTVRFRAVAYDAALNTAEEQIEIRVVETVDIDPSGANDWGLLETSIGVLRGGTLDLQNQPRTFGGLIVLSGGKITHPGSTAGGEQMLDLTVDGDVYIACGGALDALGRGYRVSERYPGETAPGGGGGGSHIGQGGYAPGSTYGSVYRPLENGGGGQHSSDGDRGGGVVRLRADSLVVDGTITADGQGRTGYWTRGGAGGSLWLTIAGHMSGGGTISARGGASESGQQGSGGGGAIAVDYGSISDQLRAELRPWGGNNHRTGGPGSVVLKGPGQTYGDLVIDTGPVAASRATTLPALGAGIAQPGSAGDQLVTGLASVQPYFVGHWVEIYDGVTEAFEGVFPVASIASGTLTLAPHLGKTPSVDPNDLWQGAYYFDNVTFRGNSLRFIVDDPLRVLGTAEIDGTVTLDGIRATDMVLREDAVLLHPTISTNGNERLLDIELSGTLTLEPGASINVSERGYRYQSAYPGESTPGGGGGGSHIGRGGYAPGSTYGSVYFPAEAGGGGQHSSDGNYGGGIVRIRATDLVFVDDTASIRANGGSQHGYWSRGGGGGSIWIDLDGQMRGNGLIEALGGNAGDGSQGSGGGGAIAIFHQGTSGTAVDRLRAWGGSRYRQGGAGSIYLHGPTSTYGDLILDNGTVQNGVTILPSLGQGTADAGSNGATLVTGLASVQPYFVGHWVEIRDAAGTLEGTWRIAEVSGGTVTLAAGAIAPSVQPGDQWQGVYRFDNYSVVGDVPVTSNDPVRVNGIQEISGEVQLREIVAGGLVLKAGAKLTHPQTTSAGNPESLRIELTGDLVIEAGASIDVSTRGYQRYVTYPGESGPGGSGGGSHIGRGGYAPGSTYGSVYRPQENGGGGGHSSDGDYGGGTVRIVARDLVLEGSDSAIRANGGGSTGYWTRGGAGGSIWITLTGELGGAGVIEAKGGASESGQQGSGGGGAIAIEHRGASGAVVDRLLTQGGSRYREGGAGSVWVHGPASVYGDLLVDAGSVIRGVTVLPALGGGEAGPGTGGRVLDTGLATAIQPYFVGHWVEIYDGVTGVLEGTWRVQSILGTSVVLETGATPDAGDRWQGVYLFDDVAVRGDVDLVSADPIRSARTQEIDGIVITREITGRDLVLRSGAHLSHPASNDPNNPERLRIDLSGDLTIETGAVIDVSGRGFEPRETYPGESIPGGGGGGSHLGRGGGSYGSTYGSVYFPQENGGGGEHGSDGRRGGGVVQIDAQNVVLDGAIRADGTQTSSYWARGGAGGSVWITARGTVTGAGEVRARGGSAGSGGQGSGGGGAISIYHQGMDAALADRLTTYGGPVNQEGGAGAVYLHGPASTFGTLIVDNANIFGGWTILPSVGGGVAEGISSGDLLDTDRASAVRPYFVGHWVEIYDGATDQLEGTYRIAEILDDPAVDAAYDGTQVRLVSSGAPPQVDPGDRWQGVYLFDDIFLIGDWLPFHSDDPVISTRTESVQGQVITREIVGNDLVVESDSLLRHPTEGGGGEGLDIQLTGDLTLRSGASIDVSGRGYGPSGRYPGIAGPGGGGGGSHIGRGGGNAGGTYGSVTFPWEHGGGGEHSGDGDRGGGRVRIVAQNLTFDDASAAIRANGLGSSGYWTRGGAGGSIWIELEGDLVGDGVIEAQGGDAEAGQQGSGGGGAISLRYRQASGTFLDTTRTWGGDRNQIAGAGSILLRDELSEHGDLIIDNRRVGGTTRLPGIGEGLAITGSAGAILVTDRTVAIPGFFVGHWVEISSPGGAVKGTFQILDILEDGLSVVLAADGAVQPSVAAGDGWRGVYRFDSIAVPGGENFTSDDAVFEAGVEIVP